MTEPSIHLLTVREVCERLSISRPTLYRKIDTGAIPKPVHIGNNCPRWRSDTLDAFLQDLAPKPARLTTDKRG